MRKQVHCVDSDKMSPNPPLPPSPRLPLPLASFDACFRYEKCMNKKHLVERNFYMAFFAAFLPLLIT